MSEDDFLLEYGISSEHPFLNQRRLLDLYENIFKMISENRDLQSNWKDFQACFQSKQLSDVVNKKESGKIILFLCSEKIFSLLTMALVRNILPFETLTTILKKLIDFRANNFVIYQGNIDGQNIVLTPILSSLAKTMDNIAFPRYLLFDYSVTVLHVSESAFEFLKTIPKTGDDFPLEDEFQQLPNSLIPEHSNLWKLYQFFSTVGSRDKGSSASENLVNLLYDEHWANFLSELIKIFPDCRTYLNVFLKVCVGLIDYPSIRQRGSLLPGIVGVLKSRDFLLPIACSFRDAADPDIDLLELVCSCLECISQIILLSEEYASYLMEQNLPKIYIEILQKIANSSSYPDSFVINIIHSMRRSVANSINRQKLFIEAGVVAALDNCLKLYGSLISETVIIFAQALALKPNKYINLPLWLQLPYKDDSSGLVSLIDDLMHCKDDVSLTLGRALQRSLQYGLSSLIPFASDKKETKHILTITNDEVYCNQIWTEVKAGNYSEFVSLTNIAKEFLSSWTGFINADQQLRLFATNVETPVWLKDWLLFMSENDFKQANNSNRYSVDQVVPYHNVDVGISFKPSEMLWNSSYSKVHYFTPSVEKMIYQNDQVHMEPILRDLFTNRCRYLNTSVTGSVWKSFENHEWYVITDDFDTLQGKGRISALHKFCFLNQIQKKAITPEHSCINDKYNPAFRCLCCKEYRSYDKDYQRRISAYLKCVRHPMRRNKRKNKPRRKAKRTIIVMSEEQINCPKPRKLPGYKYPVYFGPIPKLSSVWHTGTVWNSIDQSEWDVIERDVGSSPRIELSFQQMQQRRQQIAMTKTKWGTELISYCLEKWVRLMELNAEYLKSLEEKPDLSVKKQIDVIHKKLLQVHFWTKKARSTGVTSIPPDLDDFSITDTITTQESHVERNSELVPVWWWFISGKVCHLSHISKLPELTEKQKKKQQSLFASFNSKYHKEVKFFEFGSSWADQKHISYENNMSEDEFLQSQSSLDLINVRNDYQRNYIAFELERSLLNEKKKIKLWEEVKNEKNIFNRSLIELQILQKELIRAKDVYCTEYAKSSRKIIEKQRGVLIRYIEYLNFKEKEISLVHENSRNLFAEYFSMYFWLCDNPVSIQYLSTTYSLKSFLQKHDRLQTSLH